MKQICGKGFEKQLGKDSNITASEDSPDPRFVSYLFKSRELQILKTLRSDNVKLLLSELGEGVEKVDASIMTSWWNGNYAPLDDYLAKVFSGG